MARMIGALVPLIAVLSASASALGGTWCDTNYPNAIFCDDFDRYCISPPEAPAQCLDGAFRDDAALRLVWPVIPTDANCRQLIVEDQTGILTSHPFGAKFINGGNTAGNYLGQSSMNLTDIIRAKSGNLYDSAVGTDADPLILRFEMGDVPAGAAVSYMGYETGYMELSLNDDHAQMDYIMVGWDPPGESCASCFEYCRAKEGSKDNGTNNSWPTICQSYDPRLNPPLPNPHCPPAQTSTRMALAIGANAMLDKSPCHCGESDQVPYNWHLSFYDGFKWRILKSNVFPGNGGDFVLGAGANTVILTVKTSTVDIYHRGQNAAGTAWLESIATGVPRLYLGAFNRLHMGAAHGCNLYNGSYSCGDPQACIQMGGPRCDSPEWQRNKSTFLDFDGVALSGGFTNLMGACCRNDATCFETFEPDCTEAGGHFQGVSTHCATTTCCQLPFADADHDGDVDLDDFGAFQVCYTGPGGGVSAGCSCFNRNGDGGIDGTDFTAFVNCFSGANVPWSQGLTPLCTP